MNKPFVKYNYLDISIRQRGLALTLSTDYMVVTSRYFKPAKKGHAVYAAII